MSTRPGLDWIDDLFEDPPPVPRQYRSEPSLWPPLARLGDLDVTDQPAAMPGQSLDLTTWSAPVGGVNSIAGIELDPEQRARVSELLLLGKVPTPTATGFAALRHDGPWWRRPMVYETLLSAIATTMFILVSPHLFLVGISGFVLAIMAFYAEYRRRTAKQADTEVPNPLLDQLTSTKPTTEVATQALVALTMVRRSKAWTDSDQWTDAGRSLLVEHVQQLVDRSSRTNDLHREVLDIADDEAATALHQRLVRIDANHRAQVADLRELVDRVADLDRAMLRLDQLDHVAQLNQQISLLAIDDETDHALTAVTEAMGEIQLAKGGIEEVLSRFTHISVEP